MDNLIRFVTEHINDDISKLILSRKRWPDVDIDYAVNCIESRRKLKGKVRDWHEEQRLLFPRKLSAEQCSSDETAEYKASLALRICNPLRIADLTGGLGVDSWYFSKKAEKVLYNEMLPELCKAAVHNFSILGAGNITVSNEICETGSIGDILKDFRPDLIFLDPARRDTAGKKVFLLEDCQPDILKLKDELFSHSRYILLKLSPMADISMAVERLGSCCREVHIVSSGGECKELLILMDKEWSDEHTVTAYEGGESLTFKPSEAKAAEARIWQSDSLSGDYIFEPGKSLMKAGAFSLISEKFGIEKLGRSTHLYIADSRSSIADIRTGESGKIEELRRYGKVRRIIRIEPMNKRSLRSAAADFPNAEVTARNIPVTSDELRKKMGVNSGDDAHIYGLKSDIHGNLIIISES